MEKSKTFNFLFKLLMLTLNLEGFSELFFAEVQSCNLFFKWFRLRMYVRIRYFRNNILRLQRKHADKTLFNMKAGSRDSRTRQPAHCAVFAQLLLSPPRAPLSPDRIKESSGWQQVFTSPYLDWTVERVALNAKVVGGPHGDKDKMVAVASESSIILWSVQDGGSGSEIGREGGPWVLRFAGMCV